MGLPWQHKPDDPGEETDVRKRWVDRAPGLVADPEETDALVTRRLML